MRSATQLLSLLLFVGACCCCCSGCCICLCRCRRSPGKMRSGLADAASRCTGDRLAANAASPPSSLAPAGECASAHAEQLIDEHRIMMAAKLGEKSARAARLRVLAARLARGMISAEWHVKGGTVLLRVETPSSRLQQQRRRSAQVRQVARARAAVRRVVAAGSRPAALAQADASVRRPVALHERGQADVVPVDDLVRTHVAQQLFDVLRRLALRSRSIGGIAV